MRVSFASEAGAGRGCPAEVCKGKSETETGETYKAGL